jgi:hypothetical protein
MKRHNQILLGALAVQIILSAVVFWPKSSVTTAGEPLFPDLTVDEIVSLVILDTDGNSVELSRVSGNWVLPAADNYPTREGTVTALLDKLAGLATGRLVTRTDASHGRLRVSKDDFERLIRFKTKAGEEHEVYLGSSPRYGATHFRVDGQSETYLTSELSTWETEADSGSWVDTIFLDIPQDSITKLTVKNPSGRLLFTKNDEGSWTMEGLAEDELVNETAITSLVQRVASVSMSSPLGKENLPAYGMAEPSAVVTIETDSESVTLRVGAKDPDDNSYVIDSSKSVYYVRTSEFNVRDLVEKKREDFIQLPPTPTPEQTGALPSRTGSGLGRVEATGPSLTNT